MVDGGDGGCEVGGLEAGDEGGFGACRERWGRGGEGGKGRDWGGGGAGGGGAVCASLEKRVEHSVTAACLFDNR